MATKKEKTSVLIAGESWMTLEIHQKGFSSFNTGNYAEGHSELKQALESTGIEVTFLPNHLAGQHFPDTRELLQAYDVVILSDIPSDSLLIKRETFVQGKCTPNRLKLLVDYVNLDGGGLLMIGGYMSFSGFEGKANYRFTPLSTILPVELYVGDDRIEKPEGCSPQVLLKNHPILKDISSEWPSFLGYNKLISRPDSKTLMQYEEDPFLTVWDYGAGRVAAFASDCSPHWGSPEFLSWESYSKFWHNLIIWLSGK